MRAKTPFQIGDTVKVINETLQGTVVRIDRNRITMECADGFLYTYPDSELVSDKKWDSMIKIAAREQLNKGNEDPWKSKSRKRSHFKEIDLHIHELTDSEAGMTNYDKITLQLNTAKQALETALKNRQQKIVFIHGYGTGVLRKELHILLGNYKVTFQDASYLQYGQGATEVTIFQNKK